jgi:putative membrane protein
MMQSDPRVFFASERTLLAWVRTGIAIVGLGFVVSRFGLFLRVLQLSAGPEPHLAGGHGYSNLLGIALVLLGTASMIIACIQHGRFIATLPEGDRPARYSRTWSLWLGGLVAVASMLLAAYLAFTT